MSNNNTENLDFAIPINSSKGGNVGSGKREMNLIQGESGAGGNEGGKGQAQGGQEQVDFTNFLRHANHPCVVFFTLFFKAGAIVSFWFLNIFLSNEALTFIIVVIFSAFDFWFVKNVSGRWWSEVKDDGTEVWIFESDHEVRKTSIDSSVFWTSLYITPISWAVFLVLYIIGIKLMWAIVCLISLVLSGSNMVGYYKCSGEQKKKLSNFIFSKGTEGITSLLNMGNKK